MKKKSNELQYHLNKEKDVFFSLLLGVSILGIIICLVVFFGEKIFMHEIYYFICGMPCSCIGLLYCNYTKIKRRVLTRYGVRHKAEIVRARYGSSGWGTPSYYLEIEFTNSKGKRKTYHSPAYEGDPNSYLENQYCSIYEWKGFYVEGDFRMREEKDCMAWYGPIPTEKKHFIWR